MVQQISKNQRDKLLIDCYRIFISHLDKIINTTLEKADEEFVKLADKAIGGEKSRMLMDARDSLRKSRTKLASSFKRIFSNQFSKNTGTQLGNENDLNVPASTSSFQLSLVDEQQMEESILISKMTSGLQVECKDGLQDLTLRIGLLLGSPELDVKDNPFGPKVILESFSGAVDPLELGITAKFAVMNLFDQCLTGDLKAVYKVMNQALINENVLPEIQRSHINRPKSLSPSSYLTRGPSSTHANASHGVSPNSQPQHMADINAYPANLNTNPEEVFSLLQQLLMRNQIYPASAVQNTSSDSIPLDPAQLANMNSLMMSPEFLDTLNQIQRADVPLIPVPMLPDSVPLAMPVQVPVNVLHNIKANVPANNIGQLDSVTIDIVAMLFDHIFDDPELPDTMKNLIGRLQIPVLKAAMLDKTFFSSKANPVRQLIDTLGKTVVSRGAKLEDNDPLHIEAQRIVQRVLNEFESDLKVFSDVLEELQNFLAIEEKKNEDMVAASAKLIQERETHAIAQSIADKIISNKIDSVAVPSAVSAFFQNTWNKLLVKIYIDKGEESDEWNDCLKVVDDFIWSIAPKKNVDERKRLLDILPGLLKELKQGAATAGISENDERLFFESLVDIHTRVIKLALRSEVVKPKLDVPPMVEPLKEKIHALSNADNNHQTSTVAIEPSLIKNSINQGDIQIDEIRLENEVLTDEKNDAEDEFYWTPISLKRGQWVDFKQDDGELLRYKLSWISPKKNIYLFTNISNQKAVSISAQALEKQLSERTAMVVAEIGAIDRAMENMLGNLQKDK